MLKRAVATVVLALSACAGYGAGTDYSVILKKNIFSAPVPPPVKDSARRTILKPAPPPSLETLVELAGVVCFDEGDSFAVLRRKRRGNDEGVYREGEVVEGARIVRIRPDGVVFDFGGKTILLTIENKAAETPFVEAGPVRIAVPAGAAPSEVKPADAVPRALDPVTVKFTETMAALQSDHDLLGKIAIVPEVSEGRIDGFRVNNLPTDSLPYQYGLRNGDVIRRVNGVLIDSLAKGVAVYQQIRNSGSSLVTVEVVRSGSPIILTYRLQ